MKSIVIFLISVTCIQTTFCQQKDEYTSLDEMFATSWSGKSGLGANNITGAIQASSGYIWLTTYVGIQKFDGFKSTTYDKNEMSFIRSNGFRGVYQSPVNNALYFASQSSGVVVYRNGVFEALKANNLEIPSSVESLLLANNGKIYIGSANKGLYILNDKHLSKFEDDITANSNVLFVFQHSDSVIYFGTEGEGVIKLKNSAFESQYTVAEGLSNNIVNTIEQKGDTLILGTQSGIDMIIDNKLTSLSFMRGESVNDLLIKDGFLWAGSDNGLGRYSFSTTKTEFVTSLETVDVSRVNQLMYDREDNLWLCTGRNGLVQLRVKGIANYNYYDGLENDNINVVAESYDKSSYFIGADDGNIYHLKDQNLNLMEIVSFQGASGVRDILEQKDGTLWIASYKGVVRKQGNSETYFGLKEGFPSTDVRRILEDKNGNLWFGTRSGGLIKMKNQEIVEIYNKHNKLSSDFILSMEESSKGDIYVGTHSGGLYKISGSTVEQFNITKDDSGIIIFNTHISDNGNIWVISTAGLFLFKSGTFTKLNLRENYTGLSMYDLLEDENRDLWITTNRGLLRIEGSEINKFYENTSYQLPTKLVDEKDGMSSEECTGAVRSIKATNGNLLIPTIGGVSVINPKSIARTASFPPVYIEYLDTFDGRYLGSGEKTQISSGTNRYTFVFTALGFVAPDKIKFKYKVNNFDDDFTEASGIRRVEYTKFPPGDYSLELKSSNRLGEWNDESVYFYFTVLPAYYETYWFYFIVVSLVILTIFLLYRWRIYGIKKMNTKLIKVNQELDSFVYSASHDLRSPIASILGLIDLSRIDKENIDEYLSKMKKSMLRLDDFIGEIIEFSSNERKNVNKDSIYFEVLILKLIEELYFLDMENLVKINISVNQDKGFISDERRVTIVLRNLISNALKYRDEQKQQCIININVEAIGETATIKVEDNGIGIAETDIEKIFEMFYRASENSTGSGLGLYIVNETVQKLGGTLKIDSVLNKGTIFHIKINALR